MSNGKHQKKGEQSMLTSFFKKNADEQTKPTSEPMESPRRARQEAPTPRTCNKELTRLGQAKVVLPQIKTEQMDTETPPKKARKSSATSAASDALTASDALELKTHTFSDSSLTETCSTELVKNEKDLSEYEQLRRENIRRNNALLESLDIQTAVIPIAQSPERKASGAKRKSEKRTPAFKEVTDDGMAPRRSGRRQALEQEKAHQKEPLVALPDTWDEHDERTARKPKPSAQDMEDIDWDSVEAPPSMTAFLERLASAQAHAVKSWNVADWKQFAEDKWGKLVGQAKPDDWQLYVSSRCPVAPQAVGSDMIQERFCDDVWHLLISCLLITRVSSAETKDRALANFFHAYPTPSHFQVADDKDVFEIIKSLGLFENRMRGLRDVTSRFLRMPRFIIGLEKDLKPFGCGPFVYESYLIFCCGLGLTIQPDDKNLKAYCAWLRRHSLSSTLPSSHPAFPHPLDAIEI